MIRVWVSVVLCSLLCGCASAPMQINTLFQASVSEIFVAESDGHFYPNAEVDGTPVKFMSDTGATLVALSYETAQTFMDVSHLSFTERTTTANGEAFVARVTLREIRVGKIVVRYVPAIVVQQKKMKMNLLGMSFIKRLKKYEIACKEDVSEDECPAQDLTLAFVN